MPARPAYFVGTQTLALVSTVSTTLGFAPISLHLNTEMALAAAFAIAYGTAHVHVGVTSPMASATMICSESMLVLLMLWIGYSRKEASFYFLATLPLVFDIWSVTEWLGSAKPAKKRN